MFVFLLATGPTCASAWNLKAIASRWDWDWEAIESSFNIKAIAKWCSTAYKVYKVANWIYNLGAFLLERPNFRDILPWIYENPFPIFDFVDLLLSFNVINLEKAWSTGYEVAKNAWWTRRFIVFLMEKPDLEEIAVWLINNPPPVLVTLAKTLTPSSIDKVLAIWNTMDKKVSLYGVLGYEPTAPPSRQR